MFLYDAIEDMNEDTLRSQLEAADQLIARFDEENVPLQDDAYAEVRAQRDQIMERLAEIS